MEQWLIDLLSNLTVVTLSGLFALFVIHRYQRNKERRELKADFLTEISENFTLLRTFKLNFSNWGKMVFVANKAYRGLQYVKNEDQRQTIKESFFLKFIKRVINSFIKSYSSFRFLLLKIMCFFFLFSSIFFNNKSF